MKEILFIHCSFNNKVYRDKDFDAIHRTGINVNQLKPGEKPVYIANDTVEFKEYKTLNGALKFIEKAGMKPVAIENEHQIIPLSTKAMEKMQERRRKQNVQKKTRNRIKAKGTVRKTTTKRRTKK